MQSVMRSVLIALVVPTASIRTHHQKYLVLDRNHEGEALLERALMGSGAAMGHLVEQLMKNVTLSQAFAALDLSAHQAKGQDVALDINAATYALNKSLESMTDVWRKIDGVTSQYMELKTSCQDKDDAIDTEMATLDDDVSTKEGLQTGAENQKSSEDGNVQTLTQDIKDEEIAFKPIKKKLEDEISVELSFLVMYLDIVENAPCEEVGTLFMLQTPTMPSSHATMVCKLANGTLKLNYKKAGADIVEFVTRESVAEMGDRFVDHGRVAVSGSFAQAPELRSMPAFEDLKGAPDCREASPRCGFMRDLYAQLWGEHFDSHDTLTIELNLQQARFDDRLTALKHSKQIAVANSRSLLEKIKVLKAAKKALLERKSRLSKQKQTHIDACTLEHDSLRAEYQAHLNKFCLYKTVRDYKFADLKVLNGGANDPADIQDCIVNGNWIVGECTQDCHNNAACSLDMNQCSAGSMTITRDISAANRWGVDCPNSAMTVACNAKPCPTNCLQSYWSEWSACSGTCVGGTRNRARNVDVKPIWNGVGCEEGEETEACNIDIQCGNDCIYKEWSAWSICSRQCGGGKRFAFKAIKTYRSGNRNLYSKCTAHWDRMDFEPCKKNRACMEDEQCEARQDMIIALDASASVETAFFEGYRDVARKLIKKYRFKNAGQNLMQVGIIVFGDGSVTADKQSLSAVPGVDRIPFKGDAAVLETDINATVFRDEITNFKQMFDAANQMFSQTRNSFQYQNGKKRHQVLVVITDGNVILENQAEHGEGELWKMHIATFYMVFTKPNTPLQSYFKKPHRAQLQPYILHFNEKLVTEPEVPEQMAFQILKRTCTESASQGNACIQAEGPGAEGKDYIEIMQGGSCFPKRGTLGTVVFDADYYQTDSMEAAVKLCNQKVAIDGNAHTFFVMDWSRAFQCVARGDPAKPTTCEEFARYEKDVKEFKCDGDGALEYEATAGEWEGVGHYVVRSGFFVMKPKNCPKVDCHAALGLPENFDGGHTETVSLNLLDLGGQAGLT